MSTLKYASLFAGIGGFDLGFDRAGMECTAQVEIAPNSVKVLTEHWPNVPKGGDIRGVSGTDIGRPDVVAAGFPCKNLVVRKTGGREGLAGDDSKLYWEFQRLVDEHLRLVDETRPRWTILENTDGLLTSNSGRDLAAVLLGLEVLGYGWAYRVVNSADVGSAQRRKRVVIVGHRGGDPRPAWEVLADRPAGPGSAAAGDEQAGGERPGLRPGADEGVRVFRRRANARGKAEDGAYHAYEVATFYNTLASSDGPTPTMQKHLVEQNGRLRGLTMIEAERLQGFPDGWTAAASHSARWKALGDAMNVDLAHWLGRRLVETTAALPMLPEPLTTDQVLADYRERVLVTV